MAKKRKGKAKPYVSKGQLLKSLPKAKPIAATPAAPAKKKITITRKTPNQRVPSEVAKIHATKKPVKRQAKPATVAAKKAPAAKGDHWFHSMTKKQQAEYIKAHPRSKYAKAAKSGNTAASAKPSSAKKAKLDAIRDELKALQAKKGSMEPKAYATKLATIRAKIANASGTAKLPARKKTAAKKKPAAKTKLHAAAEKAVKSHVAEKKKLKTQIAKLHARHQKAKASTTPKGKARAAELMKQKKALQAKHATVHAKHKVAKDRLKKHADAAKAKASKAKAKPTAKTKPKTLGRKVKPSRSKVGASQNTPVKKARRKLAAK
jgi:hypothetical protein